ncbi:MAG: outer membrane protein assembly factor BamA [Verrucomicrobiota bacterium]|jgi:outer membrane protein insertion porin family
MLSLSSLALSLALAESSLAQAVPEQPPLPAGPADAPMAEPAAQKRVKSVDVRFTGSSSVDKARITSNMRLKPGEVWTREKEEDDLRALFNSGDLLNVSIDSIDGPDGVSVIVTGEARPAMGDLVFEGNTVFKTDRLRDEADFKTGTVVEEAKLNEVRAKIQELYQKRGYADTTVSYSVEQGSQPGFSRIVFRIDEGTRGILNDVRFEGNTVISSRRLKSITESDDRNWIKFWDLKRKITQDKIEGDIQRIQDAYGDAGYFDARVDNVDQVQASDAKVDLVFRITEGIQYTTGGVGVTGNKVFDSATLIPVFQLESGTTFSLADMRSDIETIEDYYGSRGYADVKVTPRISRSGNLINVTYGIEEGQQFKLGRINIAGNSATRTEVILREMALEPGDDYNTIKVKKSMTRLRNLDYFEQGNGIDFMPVASPLGAEYKDLNISLVEKKTGQVQFGAGFSTIDNLVGMVEITQRNFDIANWPRFTGAGQRFRLSLRAGTQRKDFLLSVTEPYFLGQRLSLGGDLFWTERNFLSDYFDQRDVGASINLRKPLGDNSDLRLTYTLQNVEIYDIDGDASQAIRDEEGKFLQSRLSSAWVYDNRDSFQQPRRGHKIQVEGALSGGFLGGDVEVYNFAVTGSKFWNMPFDTIFFVEGRAAVVDTFGNGERVPIFEREFLGGANNLRGFDFRDVGPKDENGEPIGGNTSAYITLEYSVPVFGKVRGAVFADAGFVNADSWDFSSSDYNANVGFGVRAVLPVVGPIKLDYGIPVTADEFNDSSGRFQVLMDYKF